MDYSQESPCATCTEIVTPKNQSISRWHSTALSALIFILPKCPFCVVAYTSSMAICGAPSLVNHQTDWGAWLATGLAVICLCSIALNYRGNGTRTALLMALLGILSLLSGLFLPNALGWYYAGAVLLFFSSFYNGRGYRWLNRFIPSLRGQSTPLPDATPVA